MSRVVVAVLTYRRPAMIAALVPRLLEQLGTLHEGVEGRVLVIDNDPDRSGAGAVPQLAGVSVVHEPEPGIPAARNRALAESSEEDFLVFIDDDEIPGPTWLAALLRTQRSHLPCHGVAGPVVSTFSSPGTWAERSGFLSRAHRRGLREGEQISLAATNNLLLDMGFVRRHGLRFDPSLGLAGGEDSDFTRRLVAAGGVLRWSPEAVVEEPVTADRMRPGWLAQHAFSQANVGTLQTLGTSPARRTRVRMFGGGVARLGVGASMGAVGVVSRRAPWQGRGLRTMMRGAGMAVGSLGWRYAEYHRGGKRWRRA